MAKKAGIVIGTAITAGVIATGGAYAFVKLNNKCKGMTLMLSGPTSTGMNVSVPYTAVLQQNGSPLANATVTLMENSTLTMMSDPTDSEGNVSFTVNFQNAGNYVLNASYQCGATVISSNLVNVAVGSGGTSGCQCPTGEVCTGSDGSCPANSFADTYNQGCCIPCSQLIPYAIEIDDITPIDLYYYVNGRDASVHPSCPSCLPNCTTNEFYNQGGFVITGKLVDSADHGICNQRIDLSVANNGENQTVISYPNIGLFGGSATATWYVRLGSGSGTTDSEGNFKIALGLNIAILDLEVAADAIPACYSGTPPTAPLNYLITAALPGTTITQIGTAVINLATRISIPL